MANLSRVRLAGAVVAACVFAACAAVAQSPAVNPQEAAAARQQQQQQTAQPLNNQPVWKEIRSGAPQFPQAGAFGVRGKMDKCTFCAGGPEKNN